jgi:predicted secreted hydrolase
MMRQRRSPGTAAVLIGCVALLLAGCGMPGTIGAGAPLPHVGPSPTAAPLPPIQFPQDEAPHHDLTEWWYYTGHLRSADARHTYGFEMVFFQTLRADFSPYYAAHFAVSDISRGAFHYDQRAAFQSLAAIPPPGSLSGFDVTIADWRMQGLNGRDHLVAAMADYAIDLHLTAATPPALHGGNGVITYGLAGFSYYYSRPLMTVAGTLTDHGTPVAVIGQAWMDHQWGNFVSLAGAGWDWFSIQLDNRTEYMLYVIRDQAKRPLATVGTIVGRDGAAQAIAPAAIHIQAMGMWTSPHTGGVYPSGWRVTISSQQLDLTLTPQLLDQELVTAASTGVAYWEGAVAISGSLGGASVSGLGYVELTGYASVAASSQSAAVP